MKIKIVSPGKFIDPKLIDFAEGWLKSKGFEVEVGEHAKGQHNYFSGTDEERLADMQEALNDPEVDAILCARGGYGSIRIIEDLDFRPFLRHPKMIFGYSDITVFHARMQRMGFESVHSTTPLDFEENTEGSLQSLINALEGKSNEYNLPAHSLNRSGQLKKKIVGGNLSIITSLIGTRDEIETKGRILFIEDVGEAIYEIDRMLWTLKKARVLKGLDGLIVGGMTKMKDSETPFGKTVDELIREAVEEYEYPLCFNFPAGHMDDNRAIILGKEARLAVTDSGSLFKQ